MESILGSACTVPHLPDHRAVKVTDGVFAGQVFCPQCDLESMIQWLFGTSKLLEMRENVERAKADEDESRAKRGLPPKDWEKARAMASAARRRA